MRFKGLDLNLLVAFDALMTERNLTAAARSINLSQPAMSAAMARLRGYFQDELFTMSGRKLLATPRAEMLAPAVRGILLQLQISVLCQSAFDPTQSDRRFRVMVSDFMTLVFFRKVVERVARDAPSVAFDLVSPADAGEEALRRGDLDFLILPDAFLSNAHPKAILFEDTLVCVGCSSNEELYGPFSFEKYMAMGHVVTRFGNPHRPAVEDSSLLGFGMERRVEVTVPSFSSIPPMLSGTRRIATIPLRLVKHFAAMMPLKVVDLPLPFPAFVEAVQWPAQQNTDPASIWMRQRLLEEAARTDI
ncbi:Nodulation protein D 2 [Mesorhizobium plurifarium]|uniref:Nodulation protein D 2 n=1 Tax=Mesorhizobium plurifarium TaxID=69974 RepID=A0A090F160_MESPL|nr:Nodulation protein D 2 [Mesorhizobium plurifarium]